MKSRRAWLRSSTNWARRIRRSSWKNWRRDPLRDMPAAVLDDLETSRVSIFAVVAQMNELRTRMQMTEVVNRRGIRHAHMVNIERRIMLEGMRADFHKVDDLSVKVLEIAQSRARDPRPHRRRYRSWSPT